jgi:cytochrome c
MAISRSCSAFAAAFAAMTVLAACSQESATKEAPAVEPPPAAEPAPAPAAVEPEAAPAAAEPAATPATAPAAAPAAGAAPGKITLTAVTATGGTLTGDTANGARIFRQCGVCHSVEPGRNGIGPSLHGVVDRVAGTLPGFKFSNPNKDSGITWTQQELYTYLENPRARIPGSFMVFAGLKDSQQRADVIAYLTTLK